VISISMPCLRLRAYVGAYHYHPAGVQQNQLMLLQSLNLRLHLFWGEHERYGV
jgi:hypothetical protein